MLLIGAYMNLHYAVSKVWSQNFTQSRLWHFSAKNVLLFGLKVLVAHVFVRLEVLIAQVFVRLEVLIAHVLVGLNRARQEHVLLKP